VTGVLGDTDVLSSRVLTMDAITLRDVTKRYGSVTAVDHLTTTIPAGALTGFLGPNGAGKTTTFRSILGLTRLTSGTIEVLGMQVGPDTPAIVKRVGAVVEEPGVQDTLNGRDNLRVAARELGVGDGQIPKLLEFVELSEDAGRKVKGYSKGMRQRLALGMALLGDPDVLLLDEPLDGLDPAGQAKFKGLLRGLVDQGRASVVVSSHNLAEVEQLADHVVIISRGRLVAAGTLEDIVGPAQGVMVEIADSKSAAAVLRSAGFEVHVGERSLEVVGQGVDGPAVSRALAVADLYPERITPNRSNLEQRFLELTEGDAP